MFEELKNNGIVKIAMKNISKERLNITSEELMQRVVRGDKSRTAEGSGLGLQLCADFARKNGGDVFVQSELGKGSTFSVLVPLKKDE